MNLPIRFNAIVIGTLVAIMASGCVQAKDGNLEHQCKLASQKLGNVIISGGSQKCSMKDTRPNDIEHCEHTEQSIFTAKWSTATLDVYLGKGLDNSSQLLELIDNVSKSSGFKIKLHTITPTELTVKHNVLFLRTYALYEDVNADINFEGLQKKCRSTVEMSKSTDAKFKPKLWYPPISHCGALSGLAGDVLRIDGGKQWKSENVMPYQGGNASLIFQFAPNSRTERHAIAPPIIERGVFNEYRFKANRDKEKKVRKIQYQKPYHKNDPPNIINYSGARISSAICMIPLGRRQVDTQTFINECVLRGMGSMGFWQTSNTYFSYYDDNRPRQNQTLNAHSMKPELECLRLLYSKKE